jgi:hypothetical protein
LTKEKKKREEKNNFPIAPDQRRNYTKIADKGREKCE